MSTGNPKDPKDLETFDTPMELANALLKTAPTEDEAGWLLTYVALDAARGDAATLARLLKHLIRNIARVFGGDPYEIASNLRKGIYKETIAENCAREHQDDDKDEDGHEETRH